MRASLVGERPTASEPWMLNEEIPEQVGLDKASAILIAIRINVPHAFDHAQSEFVASPDQALVERHRAEGRPLIYRIVGGR